MRLFCIDTDSILWLRNYWPISAILGALIGTIWTIYELANYWPFLVGSALLFLFVSWWSNFGYRAFIALFVCLLCFFIYAIRSEFCLEKNSQDRLETWNGDIVALRGCIEPWPTISKYGYRAIFSVDKVALLERGKPTEKKGRKSRRDSTYSSTRRSRDKRIVARPDTELTWKELPLKSPVWLVWSGIGNPGQTLEVRGRLKRISGGSNFGDYCHSLGIYNSLNAISVRFCREEGPKPLAFAWSRIAKLRCWLEKIAVGKLGNSNGNILIAIALGDSSKLEESYKKMFRRVGLGHALAASGLHVGILLGICFFLIRILGYSRHYGSILATIGATIYGGLVGFTPSICRALMMSFGGLLAIVCGRPCSLWRIWALILLSALALNPLQLRQIGFLMSYGALLGICTWYIPFQDIVKYFSHRYHYLNNVAILWISNSIILTLAVTAIVGPIMLYSFGEISWLSILANLSILPILEAILILGIIAWMMNLLGFDSPIWWFVDKLINLVNCEVEMLDTWGEPWTFPGLTFEHICWFYGIQMMIWLAFMLVRNFWNTRVSYAIDEFPLVDI